MSVQRRRRDDDVESVYNMVQDGPRIVTYDADSGSRMKNPNKNSYGMQFDAVGDLMNPARGVREEMQRRGVQPKDHSKENRMSMKQQSEINRLRREIEEVQRNQGPKRNPKYDHVQSQVSSHINNFSFPEENIHAQAQDEQDRPAFGAGPGKRTQPKQFESPQREAGGHVDYLRVDSGAAYDDDEGVGGLAARAHQEDAALQEALMRAQQQEYEQRFRVAEKEQAKSLAKPTAAERRGGAATGRLGAAAGGGGSTRKAPLPRTGPSPSRTSNTSRRNFVKENFEAAPAVKPVPQHTAPPVKADKHLAKHKKGQVPNYLYGRKAEIEEQKERERLAQLPPDAPPGLRLLPDVERLETLAALEVKKRELESQLSRCSLTSTTLAARQRSKAIEDNIREVEGAIGIFSKKKVFVAEDA